MDAVEFLKEKNRMCEYHKCNCKRCKFSSYNNEENEFCGIFIGRHPEKAVMIIENFRKQHPRKTILDDFKEKYPNAEYEGGYPLVCPELLGYKINCDLVTCETDNCKNIWDTPLEDAE